jgi:phage shock protein C
MTEQQAGSSGPDTVPTPPHARLTRSTTDKVVGGVAGGLGRYFGVDPVWFRLGFVVFTVAGGAGILAYLIAWIVIPEASDDNSGPVEPARALGPQGSIIAGIVLVGVGLMLLLNQFVPWFDRLMWPMAVVVGGLALIVIGLRRDGT